MQYDHTKLFHKLKYVLCDNQEFISKSDIQCIGILKNIQDDKYQDILATTFMRFWNVKKLKLTFSNLFFC